MVGAMVSTAVSVLDSVLRGTTVRPTCGPHPQMLRWRLCGHENRIHLRQSWSVVERHFTVLGDHFSLSALAVVITQRVVAKTIRLDVGKRSALLATTAWTVSFNPVRKENMALHQVLLQFRVQVGVHRLTAVHWELRCQLSVQDKHTMLELVLSAHPVQVTIILLFLVTTRDSAVSREDECGQMKYS